MASGEEVKNLLLIYRNISHQYKLESYTDSKLKSIQKSLDIAQKDLLKTLDMRDFRIPEGREHALLKELNDMTFGIQAKLTGDIQAAAKIAGENSYREYGKILSFDGAIDKTVGFNHVALSSSQLNAMVNAPVGGKLLEKWVSDSFSSHIIDGIQTMIMAENLKGVSTPEIISKMKGAFGLIHKDAETLARTHIASMNNRAAMDVYKANSDIVNRVEWSATLEVAMNGRGTCLQCAALNDRIWSISEDHPTPPIHPRCRCFILPKTKSYRELGLDIDEMKKGLRPFTERDENRKIIEAGRTSGSFEKFLNSRDNKYKMDLLGPSRYKLLLKGEVKFQDFINEKGQLRLLTKDRTGLVGKAMPVSKVPVDVVKPVVKKPVFVPAKTLQDTLTELKGTKTPTGVYLDKLSKKQEESILAGLNDSVFTYGGKLNSIGWQKKKSRTIGIAARSGDFIQFQKTATKNIHKTAPESRAIFDRRRAENIEKLKANILDPKRKSVVEYNRSKLEMVENATMWAAYTKAKDPLRAVAAHEGFHNVYFTHKLQDSFIANLAKQGIKSEKDWFKVSEYGATNIVELFAETGAAITSKIPTPNEFVKAFEDTVRSFKK